MTRLKKDDICHISSRLEEYNQELLARTGKSLLGIACHAYGKDEHQLKQTIGSFSFQVVPITAGQGIISDFCETVVSILQFIGFLARVSDQQDASGIARAFENKADAIMMADDNRFVGINLNTRSVVDNSRATGRIFASALDLMAKGIKTADVLVLGCGPVGGAAAHAFLSLGARVGLYDKDLSTARLLKQSLCRYPGGNTIRVEKTAAKALSTYRYVLEATPASDTIADDLISDQLVLAAPGVPLGVSQTGCEMLKTRLLHDKLELGVAAMAVSLFS